LIINNIHVSLPKPGGFKDPITKVKIGNSGDFRFQTGVIFPPGSDLDAVVLGIFADFSKNQDYLTFKINIVHAYSRFDYHFCRQVIQQKIKRHGLFHRNKDNLALL